MPEELDYNEKLRIFHDTFVKYTWNYLEYQKAIVYKQEVPPMTTPFRENVAMLRCIPIVKDGVDIVSCVSELWNGRLYEVTASISINKIFPSSGILTVQLLSKVIQKVAIYIEDKLNQFQSQQEIGAFATAATVKLISSLKKIPSSEVSELTSEHLIDTIIKQDGWFRSDAFSILQPQESKNYHFISVAELKEYIEERNIDNAERIFAEIESSAILANKIESLSTAVVTDFCEYIRTTYNLPDSQQIILLIDESSLPPRYLILEATAFNTDISSLRMDRLEAKNDAQQNPSPHVNGESQEINFDNVRGGINSFVGRDNILNNIHKYFAAYEGAIQIIGGLVGVGKTQTALRYANEHKEEYDYRVRLITAESESTLERSFREFAEDLSINIRHSNSKRVIKLVLDKLEKQLPKSLIIFDNAMDKRSLNKYLPSLKALKKHHIIITTTNMKDWEDSSPSKEFNALKLSPFSEQESIEYITHTLKDYSTENVRELAQLFSYIPLGFTQSVAFIRSSEISIDDYLTEYKQKSASQLHINMHDLSLEDDSEFAHVSNIYTSLAMVLERIIVSTPNAYKVIKLCSYLRAESIPLNLFDRLFLYKSEINRVVSVLKGYSILSIRTKKNHQFIDMHRIFQEVTMMQVSIEEKINDIKGMALDIVQQKLFTRDNTTKQKHESNKEYIAHVESIIEKAKEFNIEPNAELVYLELSVAVYYDFYKDHQKANEQLLSLKQSLENLVRITDDMSSEMVTSLLAEKFNTLPTIYAQICYHLGKTYLSLWQESIESNDLEQADVLNKNALKEFETAIAIRHIIDDSPGLYDDSFNEGEPRPMDSVIFQRQGILLWYQLQKNIASLERALGGYKELIEQELLYSKDQRDKFNLETCRRLSIECMSEILDATNSKDIELELNILDNIRRTFRIPFQGSFTTIDKRILLAEELYKALELKTEEFVRIGREYNLIGKIFLRIYITTNASQDLELSKQFILRAKELEELGDRKSFILEDANKLLDRIHNLENLLKLEYRSDNIVGSLIEGDQIATILQATKEKYGTEHRVEFTPTLTEENITPFLERITSPLAIKKVQFAAINICLESGEDKRSDEHWVSYVQIPNIEDADGNVVSVRSIIINSASDIYSQSLDRLKDKIENIFLDKRIQITLPVQNLDYQKRDLELYQDWNTCGIWVCHFFEEIFKIISNVENISDIKFNEILDHINISQKRQKYADLLQSISNSINDQNTKTTNLSSEETQFSLDSILSRIDASIRPSPNDKVLSVENKALIDVIKANLYPPSLENELPENEIKRLGTLVSSFTQLGETLIHEAKKKLIPKELRAKHLLQATKFFNYAISISSGKDIDSRIAVEMIEYINSELINFAEGATAFAQSALTNAINDKSELFTLRENAREIIQEIETLSDIDKVTRTRSLFETIADRMQEFLARLFQESEKMLGIPPCKYSVIGLGSIALKTITPYSDLEFAIIIEKESIEIKEYFKKLTQLVHFRIINLGETVIPSSALDDCDTDHLVKKGVSFDLGGKTPLGREDKNYDLVQTIDGMLRYLKNEEDKIEHIDKNLPYILEISSSVYGDLSLYQDYVEQVQSFLFDETNFDGIPYYEIRAIKRLKEGVVEYYKTEQGELPRHSLGDLETFKPDRLSQEQIGKFFDAKQEIYRLPDRLIYGLALLYKIYPSNPWDAINQLKEKSIIGVGGNEEEVQFNLQYLISFAVCLRLKVYIYNNSQKDEVHLFDVDGLQQLKTHDLDSLLSRGNVAFLNRGFTFNTEDLSEDGELFKFYYISIPFHKTLTKLISKYHDLSIEERNIFLAEGILSANDNTIKGVVYYRLGKLLDSITYLKEAVSEISQTFNQALQTFDTSKLSLEFIEKCCFVLSVLSNAYSRSGEYSKSVEVQKRFIELLQYLYPDGNEFVADALEMLATSYSQTEDFKNSLECHLKSLKIKQALYEDTNIAIAQSMSNVASLYRMMGAYDTALNYLAKSLQIYDFKESKPSALQINCLQNMANVYLDLGKYDKALDFYMKAFEIAEFIYKNSIHPVISSLLGNLGVLYHKKGLIDKAISFFVQSYQMNKIIYGTETHPSVIRALNNLATVNLERGNFDLAEVYILQVLEMHISFQRGDHSGIASCYYQLAKLYYQKGVLDKALKYISNGMEILESIKITGTEFHPDICDYLNFLGVIYDDKGDFIKALEHTLRGLEINKLMYKDDSHPNTVQSLCNIAMVYSGMGEFDQAISYYEQALKMQEDLYRSLRHPNIAKNLNSLANVYVKKGEINKAIELYNQALGIQDSIYDIITPITLSISDNLAVAYIEVARYEEAYFILSNNLVKLKEMHGGEVHPSIASLYGNLGGLYFKKQELNKAVEAFEYALKIQKEIHVSVMHPNIASILGNLGEVHLAKGNFEIAIDYYSQSLEIKREVYNNSPSHDIAKRLNNLGIAYLKLGRIEQAIESFEESLQIKNKIYTDGINKEISSSLMNLAQSFMKIKNFNKAIKYYTEALKIERKLNEEESSSDTADILNNLGEAYRESGEYEKAIECGLECLELKKAIYQNGIHEEIASSLNNIGNAYSGVDTELALDFYIRSLEIKQAICQTPNEEKVQTLMNIAKIYLLNKDYDNALQYFLQCIESLDVIYDEGIHQYTVWCLVSIASIYNIWKNFETSLKYIIQAHEINNKLYTAPHKEIATSLNYLGEAYIEMKIFDKGFKCFTDCLEMRKDLYRTMHDPDIRLAFNNLGVAYRKFIEHYNFSPFATVEAGMAHLFGKYDFTDYRPHYDKAISLYQDGRINSSIDEFRIALIFIPKELKDFYSLISHQLGIAYLRELSIKSDNDEINYNEYYSKIDFAYKEAIEHSSLQVDKSVRVDYAHFLIISKDYSRAAEQLLKVINSNESSDDKRESILDVPSIIDDDIVREQYAYNLILMNYEKLNEIVELEKLDDYLNAFRDNLRLKANVRGFFLLEEVLRKLGHFEECSVLIARAADLEIKESQRNGQQSELRVETIVDISELLAKSEVIELVNIIKDNIYPPILDQETPEGEKTRYEKLVSSFTQIGEVFIRESDDELATKESKIQALIEASKFFNYATSIAAGKDIDSSVSSAMIEYISNELLSISESTNILTSTILEIAEQDKSGLTSIRNEARERIEEIGALPEIERIAKTKDLFEKISDRMQEFLARLFQESEAILGDAPCGYTVVSLGSMALKTITPYSDLEFAIIIEKDPSEIKDYFKKLTQLVHFRIINLGETVIPSSYLWGCNTDHLITKGLSFDLGKKTPLGNEDKHYDLIQTINGMMHYLRNENDEIERIDKNLPYILEISDYIYGDLSLHQAYLAQVHDFLFEETNSEGHPHHEVRAINRLKGGELTTHSLLGDLEKFKPDILSQGKEGKTFDMKREIYRLPDRLIYNIALFYGIKLTNLWSIVDLLSEKEIIPTADAFQKLQKVISDANFLRLANYLKFNSQQTHIPQEDHLLADDELFEFYYTILPLYQKIDNFCSCYQELNLQQKRNFFQPEDFYDNNNANRGFVYYRLAKYNEAIECLEKADLEFPEQYSTQILNVLSTIYLRLGAYDQALQYSQRSLEKQKILHNDKPHEDIAGYLYNIATIYRAKGEYELAEQYHQDSLKMRRELYGKEGNLEVVDSLNGLGILCSNKGELDRAIGFFEESIEIIRELSGNTPSHSVIVAISGLGNIHYTKGDFKMALKYHMETLEIKRTLYQNTIHVEIASSLNNIANIYSRLGDSKKAIKLYKESLNIKNTIYKDSTTSDIADTYNNLGELHRDVGDFTTAVSHLTKSLEIKTEIYQNDRHPSIAATYNGLGNVYFTLQDFDQAIEYYSKSLKMKEDFYKGFHHEMIPSLIGLGNAYGGLRKYDEAIKYFEEVLKKGKGIYGVSDNPDFDYYVHLDTVMALNNMGNIIYRKGDFERALEHYSQSLRMQRFIYKEAINSNLAHTINNIGACYQELGDSDKAIEYYTQSLEMRRIVYQDIVKYHSEIADSLANLGKIYRQIGEIAKSNECYQECHQIRKHIEGFPSKEVAIALANIAINFKESKDILKAMIHIHKAWREILQIKNNEGKKFVLVSLEEIAKEFSMHFKLDPEIITKMVITFGFQNKDIENSELHFLKAISSYESNNIMEAINSYELSLIFITEENAHAKITIYHNLACMYQAVSLTEREKQNVDLANEYYVRAIFCFEKAIEISGANIKQGLSVEYANFLIGNKRSSEAVDYLLNAISGENDGSGLCYGLLEKESVAEILKNKIELTGKSIYIVPKEYAYYLLMHYYKELSSVAELKPQAEYLQEFKSIINSTLGYYLYGQIIQEKGLENDVFLSTGDGLKFLSIAEKELSEEGFKKLFEFCSSKHIEDSVLSESDIQEIGALFNLFLDSQEDLNYDSKVSASQGNELLKTIDKIKDFVGEKELSNLPGFYQYIFNALSNNHFSKSATQVLDIARNLISSLEKLIDISLYIQDEEIEENGDIGTSLWTQLEGLLEFTGSGQRFIGSPKPPYFDPGDDDHGGGSSSFSSSAGRGSENENITESIVISLNGTVLSNNTFENDI